MTLETATIDKSYRIMSLEDIDEALKARLFQFGLVPGSIVRLKRKAPLFSDPFLIEVSGSQIVISKEHARVVGIEEI
ncbi:MAG: hypothetical protein CME62_01075 [Halobacteriovoraceae bacterium]|nr:hypothetical protein [Halobacteriovoraceae bacterium]|tara:strand:- start:7436 stop:7666 length:231 start_codon:yes stop_codon:yes gene_type:complete